MGRKTNAQRATEKELNKFSRNYADVEAVASRAFAHVIDKIRDAKTNRYSKECEWLEDFMIWSCQPSQGQMYVGRSNLFVPEQNHQIEASVSKFQQGLFPSDDYLKAIPTNGTNFEEALKIQRAVFHEINDRNKVPTKSALYQRSKVMYGTGVWKGYYLEQFNDIFVKDRKGQISKRQVPKFRGVKWDTKDLYHWYTYPENVPVYEADLIFEEAFQKKYDLEKSGLYKNLSSVEEINSKLNDLSWVDVSRMTIENISTTASLRPNAVMVTECWCNFDIEEGEPVPCVITLANLQTVIRVERNPYWHQRPPYLANGYLQAPAYSAYGHSLSERLRSLSYMMNDLGNQTMDSLTYILNPISIIDPGYGSDINGFKLQPGAKWFASPQSVDFKMFPDVSPSGFQGMSQVRAMIQQFSDNAPGIAPQLTGKVRNATQSMLVGQAVSQETRDMIRSDEAEIMIPMCQMTHMLLRQYQSETYQLLMQGAEEGSWIMDEVRPEDLVGDVHWVWRGASASEKSAVRSQQLLGFLNIALQMNAQQPGLIDLPALAKQIARESFDIDVSTVFTDEEKKKTVAPTIENRILDEGVDTPLNPGDDDNLHIEEHTAGYEEAKRQKNKEAMVVYARHIERHEQRRDAKAEIRQMQNQLQAQQLVMGGNQERQGQAGPGNKGQVAIPSSPSALMQGLRGSEPNL